MEQCLDVSSDSFACEWKPWATANAVTSNKQRSATQRNAGDHRFNLTCSAFTLAQLDSLAEITLHQGGRYALPTDLKDSTPGMQELVTLVLLRPNGWLLRVHFPFPEPLSTR